MADPAPNPASWLYRVTLLLGAPIRAMWSVRTLGAARVPPEGPLLVAVNHTSFLDPWLLGAAFPRGPLRFLINEAWYSRSPLARFLFSGYGVVPVAAGDPEATIARAVETLARGAVVAIFPEGRISRDGTARRARSGIGYIAARSGAPVVPCGLRGAFEALPRHRRIPRRHPVQLHVGEPMRFASAPVAEPSRQDASRFARRVMEEIVRLSGRPPAVPL
jgi:1-acyl-sn-glycerol-3-phosphate acyltransferase